MIKSKKLQGIRVFLSFVDYLQRFYIWKCFSLCGPTELQILAPKTQRKMNQNY